MELITIADYTTSAQELLFESVAARPDVWDVPFETLSQHRSIRALLGHMLGAEMRWLSRIAGSPMPERYEDTIPETPVELHADWRLQRNKTLSAIRASDRRELDRMLNGTFATNAAASFSLTVEEILFHVLIHEIYHRGQCSMLLQHHAIDPPNFDSIIFVKR